MDILLYASLLAGIAVGAVLRRSGQAEKSRRAASLLLDATMLLLVASVGARTAPVLREIASEGSVRPLVDTVLFALAPAAASLLVALVLGAVLGWELKPGSRR
ncbi:MAG: hypothetical protein F7C34_03260 [Desulfurococcales archaeon]|nr:hypothetical protein [Desulfurococcales archaeon]